MGRLWILCYCLLRAGFRGKLRMRRFSGVRCKFFKLPGGLGEGS